MGCVNECVVELGHNVKVLTYRQGRALVLGAEGGQINMLLVAGAHGLRVNQPLCTGHKKARTFRF